MILQDTEFYSYLFQEEDDIIAAYFNTKGDIKYRIYFYPAIEYTDKLSDDAFLVKNGYFFGFNKLPPNEDKAAPFDHKIKNTLLIIIRNFFSEKGTDVILVFHCDDDDKKEAKRAAIFNRWYESVNSNTAFLKCDEEIIIINSETGQQEKSVYISIIMEQANAVKDAVLLEFQQLKEQLISEK
jgi:hypothetical protein